jgi:hypothetical protein
METINGKAIEECCKAGMFIIKSSIHWVRQHLLLFGVSALVLHMAISWLANKRTMVSIFQDISLYSSMCRVFMFLTRAISLDGPIAYASSHTPR